MKTPVRLVVVGVLLLLQAGCAVVPPATPTSVPTPLAPVELRVLPRKARIGSANSPKMGPCGVDINVWELPGVKPSDPNSAYMGDRGEILGTLPCRTEVAITGYAWSDTDQEFYVYVRAHSGLEGWIPINLVDLTP